MTKTQYRKQIVNLVELVEALRSDVDNDLGDRDSPPEWLEELSDYVDEAVGALDSAIQSIPIIREERK